MPPSNDVDRWSSGGPAPAVSVVVVVRQADFDLDRYLARWTELGDRIAKEVVIVGSDPQLIALAKARRRRRGLGLTVVVAAGASLSLLELGGRAARAPALLFIGVDAVPGRGLVAALARALHRHPSHGIAAPQPRRPPIVPGVVDSCWLIRSELFRALGFAPRYLGRPFCEWDLCLRACAIGYRVIVTAAARLTWQAAVAPIESKTGRRHFTERWIDNRAALALLRRAPSVRSVPQGDFAVYTAITDGYDRLKPRPTATGSAIPFVAFLDAASRRTVPTASTGWQVRAIASPTGDPTRDSRRHKILSHRSLSGHRYSLWVDGSVSITCPFGIERLIRLYLADVDLCILRHRNRSCIYREAAACIDREADEPDVIRQQIARYRHAGYPADAGLAESTVILRRHTRAIARFNEAWWHEVETGSRRDQLSFPYVARQLALPYRTFPLTLDEPGLFVRHPHARASSSEHSDR